MRAAKMAIESSARLKVDERKVLARSTDTEPDATYCMYERIVVLIVDLSANTSDVDIYDVGCRVKINVPNVL